jgi:hypothetical protein
MMGAIMKVLGMSWTPGQDEDNEVARITYAKLNGLPIVQTLADIVWAEYPERFPDAANSVWMPSQIIGKFNDHHETTQEMAERVFEKASAWLEEQVRL